MSEELRTTVTYEPTEPVVPKTQYDEVCAQRDALQESATRLEESNVQHQAASLKLLGLGAELKRAQELRASAEAQTLSLIQENERLRENVAESADLAEYWENGWKSLRGQLQIKNEVCAENERLRKELSEERLAAMSQIGQCAEEHHWKENCPAEEDRAHFEAYKAKHNERIWECVAAERFECLRVAETNAWIYKARMMGGDDKWPGAKEKFIACEEIVNAIRIRGQERLLDQESVLVKESSVANTERLQKDRFPQQDATQTLESKSSLDDLTKEFDTMLERMQDLGVRERVRAAFKATPKEMGEAAVKAAKKGTK